MIMPGTIIELWKELAQRLREGTLHDILVDCRKVKTAKSDQSHEPFLTLRRQCRRVESRRVLSSDQPEAGQWNFMYLHVLNTMHWQSPSDSISSRTDVLRSSITSSR
jgi:hypothetical protein